MKTLKTWVAAAAMVALTGTAQAALIDQGNGTVLDDTTNLIWLKEWPTNLNGLANWSFQMAWAANLNFAGYTDWRLPSIDEYVALFDDYGELDTVDQFREVRPGVIYWSGTEWAEDPGGAWHFDVLGVPSVEGKLTPGYAVAVRSGDVAAVPEPQTLALALLALGAMVVARRRRSR